MNVHSSKAQFKTAKLDRSAEYVKVPVEVQFLPTTTDATAGTKSPVLLTCINSTSAPY